MVSILMGECCCIGIPQSQERLVERVPWKSPLARAWPDGTAACTIFINVVAEGIGHKKVDHFHRQKFIGDLRVSLLPQVSALRHVNLEPDAAGCVFTARPFLIGPEQ